MKNVLLCGLVGVAIFALSILNVQVCSAETTVVTIGTGGITDFYYLTGGAISKIVNKKSKQYYLKVTVQPTETGRPGARRKGSGPFAVFSRRQLL